MFFRQSKEVFQDVLLAPLKPSILQMGMCFCQSLSAELYEGIRSGLPMLHESPCAYKSNK